MKEKPSKLADSFFIIAHPLLCLQAASRQLFVKMDHENPPPGSRIEDFPKLPLVEAAKLIQPKKSKPTRTISSMDIKWTDGDEELIREGKLPKSPPTHYNN